MLINYYSICLIHLSKTCMLYFILFHRKRVESKIRLIKKFNAATEHTAES